MTARDEFPQTAGGARSDMEAEDMLDLIDALRARVVVAEEDADRLAESLAWFTAGDTTAYDAATSRTVARQRLEEHRVAVSSRPKAPQ